MSVKERFRHNGISGLKVGDSLKEVEEFKALPLNHVKERFQEQNIRRPKLPEVSFKALSSA